MYAADPKVDPKAPLGSLISGAAGERIHGLVQNALSAGASVIGGKLDVQGAIMQPIVLGSVTEKMDIFYQESFGPVVSLFEFTTTEEAIGLANDTEFGLVASVYSQDITAAICVARKIRSGSCHINGPTVHGEYSKHSIAFMPSY
jgi:acyl-CoA reductase-like NAD-dependent aldehyde dehydrogenase